MSSLQAKPVKAKKLLNTKLLPIAALLLVVLALLFLAAPLIRTAGGTARAGNFVTSGSGSGTGTQVVVGGGATTGTTRRIGIGGAAVGRTGIILYFVMLLISLTAAVGMLFIKRWGVVLAVIMGVLYGLFGLVSSVLPLLFIRFVGSPNPVNIILGFVHLLLAVAVIVLASIPGKPGVAPIPSAASPGAS
jgi:hypothetical protein